MLLRGATLAKQGRWEGKQYKFGIAEGVQTLAPFYGLVTPEEELRINAVKNDILIGKVDTTP
jgi:basic membrane protein A